MEQKLVRKYSDAEKLQIIEAYMSFGGSMESFQATLSRWMIKFGLSNTTQRQFIEMKDTLDKSPEKTLRERTLEAKVAQLEKELKEEKLKTEAANAIIDVAEEELGIDIRKKAGAKQ
jgi:transposase-like protein